jgi:hypothetical protein
MVMLFQQKKLKKLAGTNKIGCHFKCLLVLKGLASQEYCWLACRDILRREYLFGAGSG